jgi:hypothetical protein
MHAVGSLHLLLLVGIAGAGALCGFVASVVVLRNKRRARGYFILGVLTGWLAAVMAHRRHRKLSLFPALAGGFFRPQRIIGRATSRTVGLPLAVAAARAMSFECTTSANNTVTCLNSADVAAGVIGVPHSLQNLEIGGSSVPHDVHDSVVAVSPPPPVRPTATSSSAVGLTDRIALRRATWSCVSHSGISSEALQTSAIPCGRNRSS